MSHRYYQASIQYQLLTQLSTDVLESLIRDFGLVKPEVSPEYREELIIELLFHGPIELEERVEAEQLGLRTLPPELYSIILEYLPLKERFSLGALSRNFYNYKTHVVLNTLRHDVQKRLTTKQLYDIIHYVLPNAPIFHESFIEILRHSKKKISHANLIMIWREVQKHGGTIIHNLYTDAIIQLIWRHRSYLYDLVVFLMELTIAEREIFKTRLQVCNLNNCYYYVGYPHELDQTAREILEYILRTFIRRGFNVLEGRLPFDLEIVLSIIRGRYHIFQLPRLAALIPDVLEHIEDYLNKDVIIRLLKDLPPICGDIHNREYLKHYLEAALQRI